MRTPSSLRLHGDVIRDLRESRGLTQLYVAEVVGVTVDTVSRWENNRTSTVKRENALALARALEVELEEILREEPPAEAAARPAGAEAADAAPEARPRRLPARAWLAVAAAALGAAALWALWPAAPRAVVGRRLPAYASPGSLVPVVLQIQSQDSSTRSVVLREHLPVGWTFVSSTTPPDSGPAPDGLLRWILPAGPAETQLAYLVKAPSDQRTGTAFLVRGEVVTPGRRGRALKVEGDSRIDLEWVYWGDENGDFQVSDAELLDALERVEASRKLGVDATELRALWGAGTYHWDEAAQRFLPGAAP